LEPMFASLSYPPIPILELGPISLSLHGLFAALGFVAGAALMLREARRRGFDPDLVMSMMMWGLVGALIGARLFTVPAQIIGGGYSPADAFSLTGDFSILGGYAGGIIAGGVRMRLLGLNPPVFLDMAATGLALGAVVGRIGDLAIVEHLGSPTDFFLGYMLRPGYDVSPQHDALERLCTNEGICGPYHPTALYDMIGAAVLLGTLFYLQRRWVSRHYGQMFSIWLLWYGLQRFLVDFARLEAARDGTVSDAVIGPVTGSQWGGLTLSVLGAVVFVVARKRQGLVHTENDRDQGARSHA